MKFKILLTALIGLPLLAFSQPIQVNLSSRHCEKLNRLSDARTKLIRYYRYYRRDSARQIRHKLRRERKMIMNELLARGRKAMQYPFPLGDSSIRLPDGADSFDSVQTRFVKTVKGFRLEHIDTLAGITKNSLQDMLSGMPDRTVSDKLPGGLTGKLPSGLLGALPIPSDINDFREGVSDLPSYPSGSIHLPQTGKLLPTVVNPGAMPARDSLFTLGKLHAIKLAQAARLPGVQAKIAKLMRRYRAFGNAGNADEGTKRSSLQGATFFERLAVGGTFNVVSTQPFSIDMAPRIGYKLNAFLQTGLSVNIRNTWGDSLRFDWPVSPGHLSYRAFVRHELPRSFFACAEWEKVRIGKNSEGSEARWRDGIFFGGGRKFLVHPACYMTLTALYHLTNEERSSVYARRFQIRIGFELSELATRRKASHYHPNRTR